ncbi:conserved protein of unknown function [Tenacibaculum sp. 190524A02b]
MEVINKFPSKECKKIIKKHVILIIILVIIISFISIKLLMSMLIVMMVLMFPSFWLFFTYYIENKDTQFIYNSKKIRITHKKITKEYLISDIVKSNYNLALSRKPSSMSEDFLIYDFGYWEVQFTNGDRYFLTNLIHNIHKFRKGRNTKKIYRIFPYIKKKNELEDQILKQKRDLNKKEGFISKFKEKTDIELLYIINNAEMYQEAAVTAAKSILNNRIES